MIPHQELSGATPPRAHWGSSPGPRSLFRASCIADTDSLPQTACPHPPQTHPIDLAMNFTIIFFEFIFMNFTVTPGELYDCDE